MAAKPLKIGMLSFAHLHAESYAHSIQSNPLTELAGVADEVQARAQEKAARFATTCYEHPAALLADPTIGAVVVCSENVKHRDFVEMAANAGKHILCEKPLATTEDDALSMIACCKNAGVQLMTAFPCRYSPVAQRLKAYLDSGKAGAILAFRGTNRGSNPGGWFCDPALSGGGATIDHTVHVTDIMRWLLNEDVVEVYAEITNGIQHRDFDDVSFISMKFRGGVFATLDASWSRPAGFPTWGDVTLDVVTELGTISMDMFSQNLIRYSSEHKPAAWLNWGGNMDYFMVEAFAKAILGNADVPVTGEDGLQAARVALSAYKSSKSHQPVALPSLI